MSVYQGFRCEEGADGDPICTTSALASALGKSQFYLYFSNLEQIEQINNKKPLTYRVAQAQAPGTGRKAFSCSICTFPKNGFCEYISGVYGSADDLAPICTSGRPPRHRTTSRSALNRIAASSRNRSPAAPRHLSNHYGRKKCPFLVAVRAFPRNQFHPAVRPRQGLGFRLSAG